jgi:hypothetical protein
MPDIPRRPPAEVVTYAPFIGASGQLGSELRQACGVRSGAADPPCRPGADETVIHEQGGSGEQGHARSSVNRER